jgi:hypothetical protein
VLFRSIDKESIREIDVKINNKIIESHEVNVRTIWQEEFIEENVLKGGYKNGSFTLGDIETL